MNGDALVDAVGALVNIAAPDLDSDPSSTDILTWLNLAQDMIVRNVPDDDIQSLWVSETALNFTVNDVLRVIGVTVDGAPCQWVTYDEYLRLSAVAGVDSDKAVWAYTVSAVPGNVSIITAPIGSTYTVKAVERPDPFTDAASRPTTTIPDIYDQTLILYAVAMAKIQDEEMPDAQYLLQVLGSVLGRGNLPDEAIRQRGDK